jgi:hypothetical protein
LRFLACFCQRREHDPQPATGVVVMPVRMMAANGRKHRASAYSLVVAQLSNLGQDLQAFSESCSS